MPNLGHVKEQTDKIHVMPIMDESIEFADDSVWSVGRLGQSHLEGKLSKHVNQELGLLYVLSP